MSFTTARTAPSRANPGHNRLLQSLILWYVVAWALLAISPVNRRDWLLENVPALVFVLVLVSTYYKFPFSDLSYVLMAIFLTLHAIGAHYTYSEVPLGFWLKDALGFSRNHFDRIVHFAFGFLFMYPLYELMVRRAGVREPWGYLVAVTMVQACSDLFEIIEALVAQIVAPELGNAYLGTQGDGLDAQKDMTAALSGAVIAALVMFAITRARVVRLGAVT